MKTSPYRQISVFCAFLLASTFVVTAGQEQTASNIGIERFHRVDERLYRGAQPTADGFRQLRDLGVRTVINLRLEADAKRVDEQRIVESLGMRYVHLPIRDGNFFTWFRRVPQDAVRKFFEIVESAESGPVFVHCHRGADRTGTLVALYRIARQGWDAQRAVKEAGDIGMRWWYRGLRQQIAEAASLASRVNAGSR
jgi:uncharacterized protein (TIGR01244 family)